MNLPENVRHTRINPIVSLRNFIREFVVAIENIAVYQKPQDGIPLSDINSNDIDEEPIEGSIRLITSGGVYASLEPKADSEHCVFWESPATPAAVPVPSHLTFDTALRAYADEEGHSILDIYTKAQQNAEALAALQEDIREIKNRINN